MSKKILTVDLTPRWTDILSLLLGFYDGKIVVKAKRAENREYAIKEFRRMAEAADAWNDHCKKAKR